MKHVHIVTGFGNVAGVFGGFENALDYALFLDKYKATEEEVREMRLNYKAFGRLIFSNYKVEKFELLTK